MENVLSQFVADNLEIKLTDEKIFINTAASNETFALRSVNGVGVVDLLEKYNKDLTEWNKNKSNGPAFIVGGIVSLIFFIKTIITSPDSIGTLVFCSLGSIFLLFVGYNFNKNHKNLEPKLMSAVRIMMNSGNRDFEFDKSGLKSGEIAGFVAKVENTLTAYNKNNN
jgi:hypothetical protein